MLALHSSSAPGRKSVTTWCLARISVGVPVAFLLGGGCQEPDVSPMVLEDSDSVGVRVSESRRLNVGDIVAGVGGVAMWEDGWIWIGDGNSGAIWELPRGGGRPRRVDRDDDTGRRGHTLAMAAVPGGGMLVVSRNGVTLLKNRTDAGDYREINRSGVHGLAVFDNGDYVVSHGQYPGDPHVEYAIHRYDGLGRHVVSWHPAFSHDDWRIVTAFSGGPLAVTQNGDLLFSERAPLRITRYLGGLGDSTVVVMEDETIVSASEMNRAISADGSYRTNWPRSVFMDEMTDGTILNVVREPSHSPGSRRWHSRWVAISPSGAVIARTRFNKAYWMMRRSTAGQYLALDDGGWVVELQVSLEVVER